jgi:glycosyltransferase involved in cell wall biosynthesis
MIPNKLYSTGNWPQNVPEIAMGRPLKIAIIVPDNRDEHRRYADPQPYFGTAVTALLDGFSRLADECEIHVVGCVQQPLARPEKIGPNLFYHAEVVPKWGWLRGGYLGCIRSIRRQLQKIQPDIVHGQGTERYCALAATFSGFPNVLTIHGNMRLIARLNASRPFSYQWLAARLEGFTLPRTDGVVCITRYTQAAVKASAPRTWLLPNAVAAGFFDTQPAPDVPAVPVGLCVGNVCPRKNQNHFIRALDPLAQQKPLKIIFAGQLDKGVYGAEFQRLLRDRPWCEHLGFLNHEQLKERLSTAAFLALPTREDNCPMVVLEAMAAGVPVLASNVGGVPDLIQHEVNGLLCDPDKPETFRAAIARLLADRAFAGRIAAEARRQAQRRFHPQVIAQKHLEIYREVLGNNR